MTQSLGSFLFSTRYQGLKSVVKLTEVRQTLHEILGLMYPQQGCIPVQNIAETEAQVSILQGRLGDFVNQALLFSQEKGDGQELAQSFFQQLPRIIELTDLDALAAFERDPAAESIEEVILTYPGFYAVSVHRLSHALYELKVPLIPRLFSEYAHERTGIDIHPGASIGERFFIDHGTGVVIGETTEIGKNVKIFQGVTLGALSVRKKYQKIKRHPNIEDNVIIYANSTILGGQTTIGKNSVIGGNTWITESIPQDSVVFAQEPPPKVDPIKS